MIHIEKANPEIPGLYQAINQMFLLHEFPEVQWVNREDDMGLEGLRKAKMSYNPADFARKYLVEQLLDGQKSYKWAEEIENTASENLPEYLPQEEKKETIPLWKSCFSGRYRCLSGLLLSGEDQGQPYSGEKRRRKDRLHASQKSL